MGWDHCTKFHPIPNTVLRTNKGRTNKGQITFFKKIYSELIRDKYFGKNFLSSKML